MAYGQPSGTTSYNPFASDICIDALERCSIFSIETKHMTSARRSANLLLTSKWSNRGINLWRVDREPTSIPLIQGTLVYNLTPDIVGMFDTYRRQYQMNQAANATCDFTTTAGSSIVTVNLPNSAVAVGNYTQIAVQVAVDGLILYGFYQVLSTPSPSAFTIDAGTDAVAGVADGGAVPVFTTTNGSSNVSVLLPAHGRLAGQPFVVPVSTYLGGVTIFGSYTVSTVTDANNFVFVASTQANSGQTLAENGGQTQIATQTQNVSPTDILMTPISRNDYAAQSNKFNSGAPTTYYYQKLLTPQVTIWPVTDNTGPYELRTYFMRQIQDTNPSGGQTLDLPQRMFYPFACDLARDLSIKFAPDKYTMLKAEADEAWEDASATDVENVSTFIVPSFSRS